MGYTRKKDDFIYQIKYDEQTFYYFDDSLFEGQEPTGFQNNDIICKVSEISDYVEEFSRFLDNEYYVSDGLLTIEYSRKIENFNKLPLVYNGDTEAAKFNAQFIKTNLISGEEVFDCKISLIIDLTKSFDEILSDIETLEDINVFFNVINFYDIIGVNSDTNFKEYISAERMFMLSKEEFLFIVVEYCHLRKDMKLSQISAQNCLKKIYDFEKES